MSALLHALWISMPLAVTAGADLTLHAAPSGDEAASGAQDDPLATLGAARAVNPPLVSGTGWGLTRSG
jgi:hypothetical protein